MFRLSVGGAYTQLTACGEGEPYYRDFFEVRRDGQVAVFIAPVFWYELFAVNGDGTGNHTFTDTASAHGVAI